MLLTNWTEEIPDDPGHYIVSLDIFHQLHCLVSPIYIVMRGELTNRT